jgi:hypothetical protein
VKQYLSSEHFVIPAKAGIQLLPYKLTPRGLDPHLRGGDEDWENERYDI